MGERWGQGQRKREGGPLKPRARSKLQILSASCWERSGSRSLRLCRGSPGRGRDTAESPTGGRQRSSSDEGTRVGKHSPRKRTPGEARAAAGGAQSEAPDPPIPRARARHRPQAGGHGLPPSEDSEPPSYESRRFVAVKAKAHWRQGWSSLLRTEGAPTVLGFASVLPFSTVFPGRLPAASPSAPPFWTFPTMHREHVNVL